MGYRLVGMMKVFFPLKMHASDITFSTKGK